LAFALQILGGTVVPRSRKDAAGQQAGDTARARQASHPHPLTVPGLVIKVN
jgi:hypothetical protein